MKDGKTFLDLIAEQVKVMRQQHGSDVKFVLMNSFSTREDTREFLARAHKDLLQVMRVLAGAGCNCSKHSVAQCRQCALQAVMATRCSHLLSCRFAGFFPQRLPLAGRHL